MKKWQIWRERWQNHDGKNNTQDKMKALKFLYFVSLGNPSYVALCLTKYAEYISRMKQNRKKR